MLKEYVTSCVKTAVGFAFYLMVGPIPGAGISNECGSFKLMEATQLNSIEKLRELREDSCCY